VAAVNEDRALGAVIVGTSIGLMLHLPALREAGFTVHALVGTDQARTSERAALTGVPHAFTNLRDALELPEVDAVIVATPPFTHAPLVLEAIAAGKHVVCEKPFARDLPEARSLLEAADKAGVVHLYGTEFRFDGPQALLERVIREGAIGTPRFALSIMQVPTLADPTAEVPAWFDDVEHGGGWLGGAGSHTLDAIRSALGEFVSVSASVQRLGPRPGVTVDDTYTVRFTLDTGVEGVAHSSAAIPGPHLLITKITGTSGTAWIDMATRSVWVDDGSGPRQIEIPADLADGPPIPPPAELLTTDYERWHATGMQVIPYERLYRVFRAQILGEPFPAQPVAATFADAVAMQALLEAIERSSRENQTVTVEAV
jgi:predicted dehydrogenase